MSSESKTEAPRFIILPSDDAADLYEPIDLPGGERGDSGTDLRFPESIMVPPSGPSGSALLVNLGVKCRCLVNVTPAPYMIACRSSIGKTPLMLANSTGIIDRGYTGNLMVRIRNLSNEPYKIERGKSLFQLIRSDLEPATLEIADAPTAELFFGDGVTKRGAGGFGSTGESGAK